MRTGAGQDVSESDRVGVPARGGAGPETELSSQTGPEPEPDTTNPSRTEREPTRPMLDGPGSEPGP
jgi:hypothetical protein